MEKFSSDQGGRVEIQEVDRVLSLAASLQEADRDTVTLQELERIADEAGIETSYVKAALNAHRRSARVSRRSRKQHSPLAWLLPLFVFLQYWAAFNMLNPGRATTILGIDSAEVLWLHFGLVFAIGAVWRSERRGALKGIVALTVALAALVAVAGAFLKLLGVPTVSAAWPMFARNFWLIESLLFLFGVLLWDVLISRLKVPSAAGNQ